LKLPKISIVTPSFNQGKFIEATILSVLEQNYPNLEYVIIDGGSTDNSADIISKYSDKLHYWVSEADKGMYDAISKGFEKTTGEIMLWINSDDLLSPDSLSIIAEIFSEHQGVDWITSLYSVWYDVEGRLIRTMYKDGFSKGGFMRGENLPRANQFSKYWIQQESTMWRRSLWEKAGAYLETEWSVAGDFDLWARFFQYSELMGVETLLGGGRRHSEQKSLLEVDSYYEETDITFKRLGIKYYSNWEAKILNYLLYLIPKRLKSVAFKLGFNDYRESLYHTGREEGWKRRRWK